MIQQKVGEDKEKVEDKEEEGADKEKKNKREESIKELWDKFEELGLALACDLIQSEFKESVEYVWESTEKVGLELVELEIVPRESFERTFAQKDDAMNLDDGASNNFTEIEEKNKQRQEEREKREKEMKEKIISLEEEKQTWLKEKEQWQKSLALFNLNILGEDKQPQKRSQKRSEKRALLCNRWTPNTN